MHVIKIRDEKGEERIYAAKLIKRTVDAITFATADKDFTVRNEDVLDVVALRRPDNQN